MLTNLNSNYKPLKAGNKKLDNSILTFSIPPIKTCPNCKDCAGTCYAMKAYKLYPSCRDAWDLNYELSQDGKLFVDMVSKQLSKTKKTMVRVHVAGDFYSIAYINAWYVIASRFPNIKFWTYTKTYGISQAWDNALDRLDGLDNFNIVDSMPCGRRNYGSDAYITELAQEIKATTGKDAFICPCGTDDSIKCGAGCNACANCKHVLFHQH